jgi:hypothetical protein
LLFCFHQEISSNTEGCPLTKLCKMFSTKRGYSLPKYFYEQEMLATTPRAVPREGHVTPRKRRTPPEHRSSKQSNVSSLQTFIQNGFQPPYFRHLRFASRCRLVYENTSYSSFILSVIKTSLSKTPWISKGRSNNACVDLYNATAETSVQRNKNYSGRSADAALRNSRFSRLTYVSCV